MSMRRLFMCVPKYFDVLYNINPYMKNGVKVNVEKSHRQWEDLVSLFRKLGVEVVKYEPPKSTNQLPDMVFSANAGVVRRKTFYSSRMFNDERLEEMNHFCKWFENQGYKIVVPSVKFEGAAEADFMGGFSEDLCIGSYGQRTDIKVFDHMKKVLSAPEHGGPFEVVPLKLLSPMWYHLDTCFVSLGARKALWHPGAFEKDAVKQLADAEVEVIDIDPSNSSTFACNSVVVDAKTIVMPLGNDTTASILENRGFSVHMTDMSEFQKSGGSPNMKVKVISRNPDDYMRETKRDIHKVSRNYAPERHPFQEAREYVRALNATKLERIFAKPLLASLDGHTDGVSVMAHHPNQLATVFSGSYDGEVRIWNLAQKSCKYHIQAHQGFVRGICVEPTEGQTFLSVGDDQVVKLWPVPDDDVQSMLTNASHIYASTSNQANATITPSSTYICKSALLDVSHSYAKMQFATAGDQVDVWDHSRSTPIRTYKWGVDSVHRLKYAPVETDLLAGLAADRSILVYDTRTDAPLKKVVMALRSNSLAWNPMEAYSFTVANEDYNLYTYDLRRLDTPRTVHMDHTQAVMDVAYSPTGQEFVSGSYDRTVRIFPADKGRSREVYHTKRMQRVMSVMWSLDNKYVLSGSDEMNIRLWKSHAAEKLEHMRPRERRAMQHADGLRKKFADHPSIRRIAKHRHVPKSVYSASKEHRTIRQADKRKESNRRQHSKPGAVPYVPERTRHVVKVDQ